MVEERLPSIKNVKAIQCVIGGWIDGNLYSEKYFDEYYDKEDSDFIDTMNPDYTEKYPSIGKVRYDLGCFIIKKDKNIMGRPFKEYWKNPQHIKVKDADAEISWSFGGDYWAFTIEARKGKTWTCKYIGDEVRGDDYINEFMECE